MKRTGGKIKRTHDLVGLVIENTQAGRLDDHIDSLINELLNVVGRERHTTFPAALVLSSDANGCHPRRKVGKRE